MKFIVTMQLVPGVKNQVVDIFEVRGPNRNPNLKFEKAWVGLHADELFLVVDSETEAHVADACRAWSHLGEAHIHPVVDIEEY